MDDIDWVIEELYRVNRFESEVENELYENRNCLKP